MDKLENLPIRNILCGHDYEGIGYWMEGEAQVKEALAYCRERVNTYDRFIRDRKDRESVEIAKELIETLGCGMPEHLFMALYTVTEHLNYKGE